MSENDQVRREIATLDEQLLSKIATEFPGPLPVEEAIMMNAYLVLSHGCIEERVEALFLEHAEALHCEPGDTPVAKAVAMALYAAEPVRGEQFYASSVTDLLRAIPAKIRTVVSSNNGIKRKNIQQLAKFAGVEWPAFDVACFEAVNALNTLGAKRGSVAHLSTSRTQITDNPIYPDDAREWVDEAVKAVEGIDRYLATTR